MLRETIYLELYEDPFEAVFGDLGMLGEKADGIGPKLRKAVRENRLWAAADMVESMVCSESEPGKMMEIAKNSLPVQVYYAYLGIHFEDGKGLMGMRKR